MRYLFTYEPPQPNSPSENVGDQDPHSERPPGLLDAPSPDSPLKPTEYRLTALLLMGGFTRPVKCPAALCPRKVKAVKRDLRPRINRPGFPMC